MLIITEERLVECARKHPESSSALFRWAALVKVAAWKNLVEVRRIFRDADQVGACVVFNIMGKNYRLIARIDYGLQAVTLKYFLTHAEYDRGRWKQNC